jgi:hypothetical protein
VAPYENKCMRKKHGMKWSALGEGAKFTVAVNQQELISDYT